MCSKWIEKLKNIDQNRHADESQNEKRRKKEKKRKKYTQYLALSKNQENKKKTNSEMLKVTESEKAKIHICTRSSEGKKIDVAISKWETENKSVK